VEAVLEIDERPFLPDQLVQLLICNHIAGMRQQGQQDLKRLAGQTDTYSAFEQLPRWNIYFKGSEGQPSGGLGLGRHKVRRRTAHSLPRAMAADEVGRQVPYFERFAR